MRLCRFAERARKEGPSPRAQVGYYFDDRVIPLAAAAERYADSTHQKVAFAEGDDLTALLPPDGSSHGAALAVHGWLEKNAGSAESLARKTADVQLLAAVPRPSKLFLLAGNYAKHIEEGGGIAKARAETFPYVFMKPLTTINDPGAAIVVPANSPDHIDWEVELAIVIGKRARRVSERDALTYVGGYTVVNDISDRKFRPNPNREERSKDSFFDWLHGKWHDTFCPIGPCVTTADAVSDPQKLRLALKVNGEIRQDSSTAHQIFPVAAVIEFVSNIATLEPGDVISTGTPAGVGNTTKTYLKAGDRLEASIEKIGVLENHVVNEA